MSSPRQSPFQRAMGSTLSPFWGTMTRNWLLKMVCFILAFAVWGVIRESTSFEILVHDVPVEITTAEGLAVLEQSTDVVSVRFRGSRDDIRFISRDQLSVNINLSDESGRLRQTVKFSPRYVKAPSMAHAIQFDPEEVTVTVDREVERILPVKATFEGKLPDGIELEKAVCDPASVRVRGAEQRLLELDQVHAAPVSLDGRYISFNTHVAIAASGSPFSVTPERVAVTLELVERVASRQLEKVGVRALLDSDDSRTVTIRPLQVSVILTGSPEALEGLNAREVSAYVDCAELTESAEYELPVWVNAPAGVTVGEVDPPVVQVGIKVVN